MSKELADCLQKILANSYALYLKTQNYHWNVTGSHFYSLHQLFEKQYLDLAEAIDEIAERIRCLGEKVNANFTAYNQTKTITDGNPHADSQTMLKELAEDNRSMQKMLSEALKIAQKIGDEVTVSIIADRMNKHDGNAWMLSSSLGV